eukprot:gene7185-7756_t
MYNYQPLSNHDVENNSAGHVSHGRRVPLQNHFPPNYVVPHNTIFTLTTTDGTFRPQYYLPDELEGFMNLNELNAFVNQLNDIITKTSLGKLPHLFITGLFIFFAFVFMGKSEFGYDFTFAFNTSCGKQKCRQFILQKNEELFLSRGCHWEECVLPHQVFLHLIRHRSPQTEISPMISSFAEAEPAVIIPLEIQGVTAKV